MVTNILPKLFNTILSQVPTKSFKNVMISKHLFIMYFKALSTNNQPLFSSSIINNNNTLMFVPDCSKFSAKIVQIFMRILS